MSFLPLFIKEINLYRVGIEARELIRPFVRVLSEFSSFIYKGN